VSDEVRRKIMGQNAMRLLNRAEPAR